MTQKGLGNIMKFYRKKNQLTQRQFSKLIGCSFATASKVECGKQAAKAELVLRIIDQILPSFRTDILLLEAEAELLERREAL